MTKAFDFQPILTGNGVSLAPLTRTNFKALQAAAADLATWADYPTAAVRESGDISPWFADGVERARAIAVCNDSAQRIIGTTRFYTVPDDPNGIGIGYTFLRASHRQGGQTNAELKRLMFAHAFETFDTVWFHVLPDNLRSQAAVKKLGVTKIGVQRLSLTDKPRDYVCFKLPMLDWV